MLHQKRLMQPGERLMLPGECLMLTSECLMLPGERLMLGQEVLILRETRLFRQEIPMFHQEFLMLFLEFLMFSGYVLISDTCRSLKRVEQVCIFAAHVEAIEPIKDGKPVIVTEKQRLPLCVSWLIRMRKRCLNYQHSRTKSFPIAALSDFAFMAFHVNGHEVDCPVFCILFA